LATRNKAPSAVSCVAFFPANFWCLFLHFWYCANYFWCCVVYFYIIRIECSIKILMWNPDHALLQHSCGSPRSVCTTHVRDASRRGPDLVAVSARLPAGAGRSGGAGRPASGAQRRTDGVGPLKSPIAIAMAPMPIHRSHWTGPDRAESNRSHHARARRISPIRAHRSLRAQAPYSCSTRALLRS
jgi:hypothetical protein